MSTNTFPFNFRRVEIMAFGPAGEPSEILISGVPRWEVDTADRAVGTVLELPQGGQIVIAALCQVGPDPEHGWYRWRLYA
jgi:hypothetical protein